MSQRGQIINSKSIFCVLENQKVWGEMERYHILNTSGQRLSYFGMAMCPHVFLNQVASFYGRMPPKVAAAKGHNLLKVAALLT